MSNRLAGAALLVAVGWMACRTPASSPAGPRLAAQWSGAHAGHFSARAEGEWCDSLHALEIHATAGDTGVGIVLYPADTLDAGRYSVHHPDVADTAPPPSAAVGLRWFSQTSVLGFQSDSGELTLERRPDGTLAGRFTAGAHAMTGKGQLRITGSFEGLRPTRAAATCAGESRPAAERQDSAGGQEPSADRKD